MMKNNKDAIINEYIVKIKENSNILGSLLCGSYVTDAYNSNSDIDILLLSKSHKFEMILEIYRNTLFDRMIVDPELLINILKRNSILSNVLSLSFGLI
jgi:predicted nucleotidyltransferase